MVSSKGRIKIDLMLNADSMNDAKNGRGGQQSNLRFLENHKALKVNRCSEDSNLVAPG